MKLDIYNHKQLYDNWKKNPSNPNISKKNNKVIQQYIFDMEIGKNISRLSKKGARSYTRLNHLRQKLSFIAELFETNFKIKDITIVSENDAHNLFTNMRKGEIRRLDGGTYRSVGDYVRIFKAFWHWWELVNRKKGIEVNDITFDLDTSTEEPDFVYFTQEQFNEMIKLADPDMKVVMLFLYDSGMRVMEMKNIKVSDFLNDYKEINIREETSKTFGRRFKLMMCPEVIKGYIKTMDLQVANYVFNLRQDDMNRRLKDIGKKILGVNNLTLYDFRHSSACYWYPRYPNIQGFLYRFGWKKLKMAHYYARFLGMEDTITEENMLLGVTKTELEKEISKLKREDKKIWKGVERLIFAMRIMFKAATSDEKIEAGMKRRVNETFSKIKQHNL